MEIIDHKEENEPIQETEAPNLEPTEIIPNFQTSAKSKKKGKLWSEIKNKWKVVSKKLKTAYKSRNKFMILSEVDAAVLYVENYKVLGARCWLFKGHGKHILL